MFPLPGPISRHPTPTPQPHPYPDAHLAHTPPTHTRTHTQGNAIIDETAKIGRDCLIGPNVAIGKL